jgi:orotate phosphoribosyltransferase
MMDEQEILKVLEKVGAIIGDSHIVYKSRLHGGTYVNKEVIYQDTQLTSYLSRGIAESFEDHEVDVVIGPEIGGRILSQWVAYHLSELNHKEIFAVYAKKDKIERPDPEDPNVLWYKETGDFVIQQDHCKLIAGKNVLVVEDVLTTGDSARRVVEATRSAGGNVIGLGALCNRGRVTEQDVADVPKLLALTNINRLAWNEAECPLCTINFPINTDVGHGREFLARKRA